MAKSASAGSGKTTALVFRYISLLLNGAKPSEIVALTFTVKAANNMKERIVKALSNISEYPFLSELSAQIGASNDELILRADSLAKSVSISQMRISTLDSFFASILSKFCFYANVPYGFETLESSDLAWLRKKFLNSLDENQKRELAIYLSSHKRKLRYFFELFELFDEKNLDPKLVFKSRQKKDADIKAEIAALVNIIVNEMESEREKNLLLSDSIEELAAKTIFNHDKLNEHGWLKKKQFSYDANEAFVGLKNAIKEYFRERESEYIGVVSEIYDSYKKTKFRWMNRLGKLTFSDVSTSVHKLLCSSESIDTDFLYFRLDSKINHILIDEFQDTSLLQYEILKPLIDEIASGVGQSEFASFFFVGDVKQSIYRFRGGFSQLFDFVASSLSKNGLIIEKLNTNYRSDKAIVEFANSTFLNIIDSYEFQEYSPKADDGFVEVIECDSSIVDDENSVQHPLVLEVLKKIELLVSLGAKCDDIAVLTPTNADSLAVLNVINEMTSLKAVQETSTKLIEQQEPKAIINYLKYCFFGEDIYKENFLAISKMSQFADIKKVSMDLSPTFAVLECMKIYGLNSREALSLSSIACEYDDMYDFVQNIEKNSSKTPEGSGSGIRVLTVHKSKGLEFKYVVCMDRIASRGQSDDDILIEFDGLDVKQVYFRFSSREKFDDEYKYAWEMEAEHARRDRLNMLYVAFTRAEHVMFIIKKASNIKKDGSVGAYTGVFDIDGIEPCTLGNLKISNSADTHITQRNKVSFDLKDHGRQKVEEKVEDIKNIDDSAKYFGLALHLSLEMIDFKNPDKSLDEAMEFAISKSAGVVDEIKLRNAITTVLSSDGFNEVIAQKELFKECSFFFDGKVKRIDLLALGHGLAVVVDYKSSMFQRDEHKKQIATYSKAVNEILQISTQTMLLTTGQI